ncbi:MAG: DUF4389 domain-containing protein [Dehalococcoidia bacterium]
MATMAAAPPDAYPIRVEVPYPESLSRGLIFVKWLLAIPHLIILYFLQIAWSIVTLIAVFAILFTEKYPEGLFKFAVGYRRWQLNAVAYVLLLRDEYPPFSLDAGQYPAVLEVDYPERLNRFLPFIKWLLVLPNLLVAAVVMVVALILTIVAWFAILFTGKYPQGMFDFVVGALRWSERASEYAYLFTDRYPPFSLK